MTRPDEILVAILQVGNDRRAPKILNDLDQEIDSPKCEVRYR